MANTATDSPIVRFGDFRLDLRSGELAQNGSRVLLPDQPFRLLAILIRARGALVTRDDLRRELWPQGTFVDFERSLNAAVKRVREALGDSAAAPQFIETLPKRGYRFIAPVEKVLERASVPTGIAASVSIAQSPVLEGRSPTGADNGDHGGGRERGTRTDPIGRRARMWIVLLIA